MDSIAFYLPLAYGHSCSIHCRSHARQPWHELPCGTFVSCIGKCYEVGNSLDTDRGLAQLCGDPTAGGVCSDNLSLLHKRTGTQMNVILCYKGA